jgi:MFS family permease
MDSLAEHSTIPSAADISREGGISVSQLNGSTAAGANTGHAPRHLFISLLTMFAFGPQYVLNVSYMLNQTIIQNTFAAGSYDLLLPSVISNLAFALCVPFGPVFSRQFGLRRSYLTLVLIFLFGSVISLVSPEMPFLTIGRLIQGLSAGALFLTILPVGLISFPNQVRNWFLFLAIGGLFGASSVGAFLGSLSLSMDAWRWLFMLCCLPSLLCLWVGAAVLPRNEPKEHHHPPFDRWGALILAATVTVVLFPLVNLEKLGFGSVYVWPFFVATVILFAIFIVVECTVEAPLVPFRSIQSVKQASGVVMAIASHVALIVALMGTSGFLRNVKEAPFVPLTYFYLWFIVGVVVAALLSTWLYDKVGAGILGMIGSLAVILVSVQWRNIGPDASFTTLNLQMGCVGGSIGMVLVSGALATALAGDIHQARWRSVTLHFNRNFIAAIVVPVVAWFLYKETTIHYENLRGQISLANPQVNMEMAGLTQHFVDSGHAMASAKTLAFATLMMNSQKASLLNAYQDLFTMLLVSGVIMAVASIGMAVTGKGRSLVQKEQLQRNPALAIGPIVETPGHRPMLGVKGD